MRNWLLDKECNDQYSVISDAGETTAILLNSKAEASVVEERKVSHGDVVQMHLTVELRDRIGDPD